MLSSLLHQQESKREAPASRKRPTGGHSRGPVGPQGTEPEPRTRQTPEPELGIPESRTFLTESLRLDVAGPVEGPWPTRGAD